jgi:hypothetical protein
MAGMRAMYLQEVIKQNVLFKLLGLIGDWDLMQLAVADQPMLWQKMHLGRERWSFLGCLAHPFRALEATTKKSDPSCWKNIMQSSYLTTASHNLHAGQDVCTSLCLGVLQFEIMEWKGLALA